MTKRLFWNFELHHSSEADFTELPDESSSPLRWETRYFWPETTIIGLSSLPDDCFNLALYDIKERQDTYYVLPHHHCNIKKRRNELLYKPLIEQDNGCYGFDKKINLSTQDPLALLPGTNKWPVKELLNRINCQSIPVVVNKIALIYKLNTYPKIKLEFSRLVVANKLFFSLCVEGRSQQMVSTISGRLLNQQTPCDYVHFLKEALL